jgi:hypothetical protein
MGARSRLTVSTKASTRARHWRLFACWGGTHTGRSHRKAKAFLDPRLLSWDATRERCLRPRVELGGQSVPHAGQFDVGVTLFLEVPFRQLWCITSLSRKKCPHFDWAPPGVVCATPAGLGIRSCPGRGPRSKDHLRPNAGA